MCEYKLSRGIDHDEVAVGAPQSKDQAFHQRHADPVHDTYRIASQNESNKLLRFRSINSQVVVRARIQSSIHLHHISVYPVMRSTDSDIQCRPTTKW
ncbi:hypothetical protein ACLB2K_061431 [Fragaria x ananassa]